jgi:hypothetical protein
MAGPTSVLQMNPVSPEGAQASPLPWFDTARLSFQRAGVAPDYGRNQSAMVGEGHDRIDKARAKAGMPAVVYPYQESVARRQLAVNPNNAWARQIVAQADTYWQGVRELHRRGLLIDMPGVVDGVTMQSWAQGERRRETARLDLMMKDSPFTAQIGGALAYGLTDPINYIPIGGEAAAGLTGGRAVLSATLRGAATNAAMSAALIAPTMVDAEAAGMEYGAIDAALDVTVDAILGGVLEGGVELGGQVWRRRRAGTVRSRALADTVNDLMGDNLTPEQRAATNVVNRTSDIAEANPFTGPDGSAQHVARTDAAIRETLGPNSVAAGTPQAPTHRAPRPHRVTPTLPADIVQFFLGKGYSEAQARGIAAGIAAESRGGDHTAINPDSGAQGLGQWLGSRKAELHRRYGPNPTRQQQLEFLHWELQGGDHGGRHVLAAGDETQVLDAYIKKFMRPAKGAETEGDLRRGAAALGRERGEIEPGAEPLPEGEAAAPDVERPAFPAGMAPEAPDVASVEEFPQLDPDQFADPLEHRLAQEALEAELRGAEAGPVYPIGTAEAPTNEMLAARATPPPASPDDALARLEQRLARIAEAGEDMGQLYDSSDRRLLMAAQKGGIKLLDYGPRFRVGAKGTPRPAADVADDLANSDALSTVLMEEIGHVTGREDLLAVAAGRRPEIFADEYYAELQALEAAGIRGLSEQQLRDRILARRTAGRQPPDVANDLIDDTLPTGADPHELDRWVEPGGDGPELQTASLEHDLRMELEAAERVTGELSIYRTELSDGTTLIEMGYGGEIAATVHIDEDGVGSIDIAGPGPGALGAAQVRDIMRRLHEVAPELKELKGERVTGARRGRETTDLSRVQSIRLPEAPEAAAPAAPAADDVGAAGRAFAEEMKAFADEQGVDLVIQIRDGMGGLGETDLPPVAVELTDLYARTTGTGAGTRVMERLAERADELRLAVYVKPEQPRNVEFYQRFGFEPDEPGFMVRYPDEPMPEDFDPDNYPEGYAEAMGWLAPTVREAAPAPGVRETLFPPGMVSALDLGMVPAQEFIAAGERIDVRLAEGGGYELVRGDGTVEPVATADDARARLKELGAEDWLAVPSTDEGEQALADAGEAIRRAIDDQAVRVEGRKLIGEYSDATHDELANAILDGADPDKEVQRLIKAGKITFVDKGEPELKEIKPVEPSTVVPAPPRTFHTEHYVGPELPQAVADARLAEWKAEVERIRASGQFDENDVVVSLFDASGIFSRPYEEMGMTVIRFDLKRGHDLMEDFQSILDELDEMVAEGARIRGVIAQPPCTTFTNSGARWQSTRHDRVWDNAVTRMWGAKAAQMFDTPVEYNQTLVLITEEMIARLEPDTFFVIENPAGRIERLTGLPKPLLVMQPHHFGSPYTKRTHLWGDFEPVLPTANVHPAEGSKMHKLRGRDEKNEGLRSLTPEPFAYAFALANTPARAIPADLPGAHPVATEIAEAEAAPTGAAEPTTGARPSREEIGTAPPAEPPLAWPARAALQREGVAMPGPVFRNGQPKPLLRVIAEMGGIRDDEGHGLIDKRNLQRLIPGVGPLIRPGGQSIDDLGEALWEAGWFGPPSVVDRPLEDEVLQLIERASFAARAQKKGVRAPKRKPGEPKPKRRRGQEMKQAGEVYHPEAEALAREQEQAQAADYAGNEAYGELTAMLDEHGFGPDDVSMEAVELAIEHRLAGDDPETALAQAIEAVERDRLRDAGFMIEDADYGDAPGFPYAIDERPAAREAAEEVRIEQPAPGGAAGAEAAAGPDVGRAAGGADTPAGEGEPGRAAGGAVPRGGGPGREGIAQGAGDAGPQAAAAAAGLTGMRIRLDEAGREWTVEEILEQLDRNQAAVDALRGCLDPGTPGGGE